MKFNLFFISTDTCFGLGCPMSDDVSYRKIYAIKKRSYDKPLSIMVEDFNWLSQNSDLTSEQIDFLKNYKNPFTILTNSLPVSHWINYEDEEISFENRDIYKQIAFRVAHTPAQKKLIKKVWPIFLTSANTSGEPELYTQDDIIERFNYEIEKYKIDILGDTELHPDIPSSDIFEFVWESLEVKYLRQN